MNIEFAQLYKLARLYDVQVAYYDMNQHRKNASIDALVATLRTLGAPICSIKDATVAIDERHQQLWEQKLEPVAVAWNGNALPFRMRLPAKLQDTPITVHLTLENGEYHCWQVQDKSNTLPISQLVEVNGVEYVVKHFILPVKLPLGYHCMTVDVGGELSDVLLISAPGKAYSTSDKSTSLEWGAFAPLYALKSNDNWGGGDFSSLESLTDWVSDMGGNTIATLPLVASFYERACDLSPYSPASRMFWNEVYIDLDRIDELKEYSSVQKIISSHSFQSELTELRKSPRFDYRKQMQLKRRVLSELSNRIFSDNLSRAISCVDFVKRNPGVEDYAEFRASCEKYQAHWPAWPSPQRDGILCREDYDEDSKQYHLLVQWLADRQLKSVYEKAKSQDIQLYFDLPLGVNPDGYDVWRNRDAFLPGVSAGAPPDAFFTRGQDWGLPPLHPEAIRKQGYKYYIDCLRHNLKYAGILRIDHIMSYHRLFVIPHGFTAGDGIYIHYNAPEFYALITLESHRHKTEILGEDLGTVPSKVRDDMVRHSLCRHYVVQYEIAPDQKEIFSSIPSNVVASINTHDMPTFAGFWQGEDLVQRETLGLLDKDGLKKEKKKRAKIRDLIIRLLVKKRLITVSNPGLSEIIKGIFALLGSSQARFVLVNLEDLWQELRPQNVPGTVDEYSNYCRRFQFTFEEFSRMPGIRDTLNEIAQRRKIGNERQGR